MFLGLVGRVLCAEVFCEVNVEEAPFLADLGAGDLARPRPLLQGVRMQAEECGSGGEV